MYCPDTLRMPAEASLLMYFVNVRLATGCFEGVVIVEVSSTYLDSLDCPIDVMGQCRQM